VDNYEKTLFLGEQILSVKKVDLSLPEKPLPALQCLMRLCRVERKEDIGLYAPIAATALPQHEGEPELRLFEALFGRDSLRVSSLLVKLFPRIAEVTIKELVRHQGIVVDELSEQQPGKIIHEYRETDDPVGNRLVASGWKFPYYGACDSTPLFLAVLGEFVKERGSDVLNASVVRADGTSRTVGDCAVEAGQFLENQLARSGFYQIEYRSNNLNAIVNQTWRDSGDSYYRADGSLVNYRNAVAPVEVQCILCDALLILAELIGPSSLATRLSRLAEQVMESFIKRFWVEDSRGAYLALATERSHQGDPQPLCVRSSAMGHVLDSKIAEAHPNIVDPIVESLFSEELLAAGGIRTLSSKELRYNPHSYHNGSVWPWDTAVIARGLGKVGKKDQQDELLRRLVKIHEVTRVFPEFVVGVPDGSFQASDLLNDAVVDISGTPNNRNLNRTQLPKPTNFGGRAVHRVAQPPQLIQAWSVAAVLHAQSELGLISKDEV
jgi:glycogen debranching enzyme